ncbi:MAG: response regulator [Planctomycetota bacterium]|jgi:CheY-like chemotaxis protein
MRILVAEDETLGQRLLSRLLEEMGHEPVVVADGEAAWRAFCDQPFGIVITDWRMPGMDGLELARRIRAARTRSYTWLIMLTGMDAGESFRRAMDAGVDDFLTKPLDHERLRVRLRVAERVHRMTKQVSALASVLPVCMHCKQVRDEGDNWKRVGEYIRDIDFSHSYCPECYYHHSLLPELLRMRSTSGEPAASEDCTLDERVLGSLDAFTHDSSPGLLDDLLDGLAVAVPSARADLAAVAAAGLVDETIAGRIQLMRNRCADLGASRSVVALDRLATLAVDAPPDRWAEAAETASTELELLGVELERVRTERRAGGDALAAATP